MPLSQTRELDQIIQRRMYDIRTDVIYVGTAQRGISVSQPGWTIERTLIGIDGLPTSTSCATESAWDDRETAEYY